MEFGDEAYVVTPFTTDYDNVLLSLSLVGDWTEYLQFPDGGTAIGRAIVRGTDLFKAFDFLHASGNVMVIFSDGQDTQVTTGKRRSIRCLHAAVSAKIPVYLIRTGRDKTLGQVDSRCHLEAGGGIDRRTILRGGHRERRDPRDRRHRQAIVGDHRAEALLRRAPAIPMPAIGGCRSVGDRAAAEAPLPQFTKFP